MCYDFNESDMKISNKLNILYLGKCYDNGAVIPWETLRLFLVLLAIVVVVVVGEIVVVLV